MSYQLVQYQLPRAVNHKGIPRRGGDVIQAGEHPRLTMARAIALRSDFNPAELRRLARRSRDAAQARRLQTLAAIYDGGTLGDGAARPCDPTDRPRLGGALRRRGAGRAVRPQGARPEAAADRRTPPGLGRAARPGTDPGDPRRGALAAVRSRPLAVGGVPRLGLDANVDPGGAHHGLPEALGPAEPSRPGGRRHRDVQKNFHATLAGIAREQDLGLDAIEICFVEEAGVGQKNGITGRCARRGTKPAAPQDQRYASVYIFGAICPQKGKGAALVLPFCNTAAMKLHLAEISALVHPGRHALLLLDQAGWHLTGDVTVPPNITLLPLPPKSPELNVLENAWQFIRDNWISNRVFRDQDDMVDHCCHHWTA